MKKAWEEEKDKKTSNVRSIGDEPHSLAVGSQAHKEFTLRKADKGSRRWHSDRSGSQKDKQVKKKKGPNNNGKMRFVPLFGSFFFTMFLWDRSDQEW